MYAIGFSIFKRNITNQKHSFNDLTITIEIIALDSNVTTELTIMFRAIKCCQLVYACQRSLLIELLRRSCFLHCLNR